MKLILPARHIPEGSTVTKRNGTNKYTLVRKIRIFPEKSGQAREELTAKDGCVFLVNGIGDVNTHAPTTEFVWEADDEEVLLFVRERLEGVHHYYE